MATGFFVCFGLGGTEACVDTFEEEDLLGFFLLFRVCLLINTYASVTTQMIEASIEDSLVQTSNIT